MAEKYDTTIRTVSAAEVLNWPPEALTKIRVVEPTGNVEEWQEAQTAWDWVLAQAGQARRGMSIADTRMAAAGELAQVGKGVEVCSRSRTGGEWWRVMRAAQRPADVTTRRGTGVGVGGERACAKAVGVTEDEDGRIVSMGAPCVLPQGHRGACRSEVRS